tara:strand:- start:355 stop:483 length:129 start_codon:yes stop_codon:yes gene_type:complete
VAVAVAAPMQVTQEDPVDLAEVVEWIVELVQLFLVDQETLHL